MGFNFKEFLIFALVVFLGGIAGGWVNKLLGLTANDSVTQAIAFLIPTAIIYIIWKKWGQKASR